MLAIQLRKKNLEINFWRIVLFRRQHRVKQWVSSISQFFRTDRLPLIFEVLLQLFDVPQFNQSLCTDDEVMKIVPQAMRLIIAVIKCSVVCDLILILLFQKVQPQPFLLYTHLIAENPNAKRNRNQNQDDNWYCCYQIRCFSERNQ